MAKSQLVELFVYSQNKTTEDGRKFVKHTTKARFFMRLEDGKLSKEKVEKYINVKFSKEAFDGSNLKESDIKRGKLVVDGKCISLPEVYEITVDPKTNKKVYPACWIRGGIKSFTPVAKEHVFDFVVDEDMTEVEIEEENE